MNTTRDVVRKIERSLRRRSVVELRALTITELGVSGKGGNTCLT